MFLINEKSEDTKIIGFLRHLIFAFPIWIIFIAVSMYFANRSIDGTYMSGLGGLLYGIFGVIASFFLSGLISGLYNSFVLYSHSYKKAAIVNVVFTIVCSIPMFVILLLLSTS